MPQTKEKKKVFSKFRPLIHSGEIKDNSDFVCSLGGVFVDKLALKA